MEQLVSALHGEAEQWESTILKMTYRHWSVLLHLKSIPFSKRFVPLPKRFVSFSKRFVPSPKRSVSFRTSWFIYSNQTDFFAIPWVTRLELVLDTYRAIFASQGWRYASLLRSVLSPLASEDASERTVKNQSPMSQKVWLNKNLTINTRHIYLLGKNKNKPLVHFY